MFPIPSVGTHSITVLTSVVGHSDTVSAPMTPFLTVSRDLKLASGISFSVPEPRDH